MKTTYSVKPGDIFTDTLHSGKTITVVGIFVAFDSGEPRTYIVATSNANPTKRFRYTPEEFQSLLATFEEVPE